MTFNDFISLYLMNLRMDLDDIMHSVRYWSEVSDLELANGVWA